MCICFPDSHNSLVPGLLGGWGVSPYGLDVDEVAVSRIVGRLIFEYG